MVDDHAPFVARYLRQTSEMAAATDGAALSRVIAVLFEAYQQGATLYTCGNGGSAASASHLACDLSKFTWAAGRPRLRARSLCDNPALLSALTNDEGFGRIFAEQLEGEIASGDVLICLSVHGGSGQDKAGPWSQNLVHAAELARHRGARVVALLGYDGGKLAELADACVIVPPAADGHTSTPHVEGFHEIYHHLICERLRQLIAGDGAGRGPS